MDRRLRVGKSDYSHSMVLSHGNALIFQRKVFLLTVKARPSSRQNFSLMIPKENSGDSDFVRFRGLSTTIGRFLPKPERAVISRQSGKRPSPLIDRNVHVVEVLNRRR